jgi:neutral ceramidase
MARPKANEGSGTLLAGAGKTDITPIPGYPMGGHSFEGEHSAGNLGHLHARAIYLEDPRGEPVVLVAADLWAISIGLRDRVVELIQREHGLWHVGREHVILGATHTHQSPAAHASNHAHNLAGGNIWAFDRQLFDFIARGIALSVAEAYASREPARLSFARPRVGDYGRNRSLEPFEANPDGEALVEENADLPPCTLSALTSDPKSCKAIDPGVTVLLAEGLGEGRLIAAGVFMGIHATAMPNSTVYYQGDVFGLSAVTLERRLAQVGAPVVAVFNGPEGDVSPTWKEQRYVDLLASSARIVDGLWPVFEAWGTDRLAAGAAIAGDRFRARHGLFRVSGQRFTEADGTPRVTGRRAMMATSMLGGAEDGRTRFRKSHQEGRRKKSPRSDDHGHGYKQRSFLQPTEKLLPPEVPLTVLDLDGLRIASLPGEFTTVMGRRVRLRLAADGDEAGNRVVLIGLANEYRSYFTTPEEYALQHYEGGSTLYGTHSGSLIQTRLSCLAGQEEDCGGIEYALHRDYGPGPETRTGFVRKPRSQRWLTRRAEQVAESVGPSASQAQARPALRFEDRAPRWSAASQVVPHSEIQVARGCDWHTLENAGVPQTGAEYRVLQMVRGLEDEAWEWESTWLTPELSSEQRVRIKAIGVDGEAHCSSHFGEGDLRDGSSRVLGDVGCQPPPGCD